MDKKADNIQEQLTIALGNQQNTEKYSRLTENQYLLIKIFDQNSKLRQAIDFQRNSGCLFEDNAVSGCCVGGQIRVQVDPLSMTKSMLRLCHILCEAGYIKRTELDVRSRGSFNISNQIYVVVDDDTTPDSKLKFPLHGGSIDFAGANTLEKDLGLWQARHLTAFMRD